MYWALRTVHSRSVPVQPAGRRLDRSLHPMPNPAIPGQSETWPWIQNCGPPSGNSTTMLHNSPWRHSVWPDIRRRKGKSSSVSRLLLSLPSLDAFQPLKGTGAGRIVEAYTQRYAQLYALARSQRSPVVTPPRPMTNLEWMGSIVAHNERVRQQAQQIPDAHPTDRRNSSPGPPISLGPIPEPQRRAEQAISNAMDVLQRRPLTHLDHLR